MLRRNPKAALDSAPTARACVLRTFSPCTPFHKYTSTHPHSHACTHIHAQKHTRTRHTHARTHTHTQNTQPHTHKTHTRTRIHTQTHTNTHQTHNTQHTFRHTCTCTRTRTPLQVHAHKKTHTPRLDSDSCSAPGVCRECGATKSCPNPCAWSEKKKDFASKCRYHLQRASDLVQQSKRNAKKRKTKL